MLVVSRWLFSEFFSSLGDFVFGLWSLQKRPMVNQMVYHLITGITIMIGLFLKRDCYAPDSTKKRFRQNRKKFGGPIHMVFPGLRFICRHNFHLYRRLFLLVLCTRHGLKYWKRIISNDIVSSKHIWDFELQQWDCHFFLWLSDVKAYLMLVHHCAVFWPSKKEV